MCKGDDVMKKQKSMRNKGFSMVELLIVMAIMAILVGVIGSQAIPYLEKARESKDLTTLDTVYNSFQAAIVETGITEDIVATGIDTADTGLSVKFAKTATELKKLVGSNVATKLDDGSIFTSKKAKTKASVTYTFISSTGKISVSVGTGNDMLTVSN